VDFSTERSVAVSLCANVLMCGTLALWHSGLLAMALWNIYINQSFMYVLVSECQGASVCQSAKVFT